MKQTEQISLEVPADVIVDVATIIVKHSLSHSINGADEEKGTILMAIEFPETKKKAQTNIEEIIEAYNWFRYGEE